MHNERKMRFFFSHKNGRMHFWLFLRHEVNLCSRCDLFKNFCFSPDFIVNMALYPEFISNTTFIFVTDWTTIEPSFPFLPAHVFSSLVPAPSRGTGSHKQMSLWSHKGTLALRRVSARPLGRGREQTRPSALFRLWAYRSSSHPPNPLQNAGCLISGFRDPGRIPV